MIHRPARLARRWWPLAAFLVLPGTPVPSGLERAGLSAEGVAALPRLVGAMGRAEASPLQQGRAAPLAGQPAAALPAALGATGGTATMSGGPGASPAPGNTPVAESPTAADDQENAVTPAEDPPRIVTVRRGDTLAEILADAGIARADAGAALEALTASFPARHLQPGQVITLHLDPEDESRLSGLALEPEPGRRIRVERQPDPDAGWTAEEEHAPELRHLVLARGEVQRGSGIAPSLLQAGLPAPLVQSMIRLLAHEVDFQRDIQPGDRFTVLFERYRDADAGEKLRDGALVHVELFLSGERHAWWRHRSETGAEAWFDAEGRNLRRGLLRTPLDGARISSGFGKRAHPILGFTRMHQGVDFAAPAGTPVYAAADGEVVEARSLRGYGRTIRLRHGKGGMETLYAHLSSFARGLKPGVQVRQGEVIGRVGSTGLSTGPHLHYEVRLAGKALDPRTAIARGEDRLEGRALAAFQRARGEIETRLARLEPFEEVAWAE